MARFVMNLEFKSALSEIIETSFRNIPPDLLPVEMHDQVIGYVTPAIFLAVQHYLDDEEQTFQAIHCAHQKIILADTTPHALSIELRILAQHLRALHLLSGWRDEEFAYLDEHTHERFRVERTFFRAFGLHSRAVHINGYTADQQLWLARRSPSKHIDPDMLDNITAGGVSVNETLLQCALRELQEEASVGHELSQNLIPVNSISVRRGLVDSSLHHETLYTYDLLLPKHFKPVNQDHEVSEFMCVSFEEALDLVLNEKLTYDAAVVSADFLLRHC